MENIKFEYPASYLLLCALIAVLYAVFMYFRDERWKEKATFIPYLLATARAILVFILCVLLLSPFLTFFQEQTSSPKVVLAYDASESMNLSPDSILDEFQDKFTQLKASLSEYDVEQIAFGETVRPSDSLSFEDKKTNISALFDYVQRQFAGQTIGGLVVASDGLYNVSQNPLYASSDIKAPIYTIPLGDTSARKDLAIPEVYHNEIAYLNDRFNIQVDVEATQLRGSDAKVEVFHKKNGSFVSVAQSNVSIDESDFFSTLDFTLNADRAGMQQYRITLSQLENEISYRNNSQDFFIDIIDSRQKILIFAAAPHPDVSAIRQLLAENDNYEIELAFAEDSDISFNAFDLIFLHQIPFKNLDNKNTRDALASKPPKIYICGLETATSKFNQQQSIISIQPQKGSPNAVEAELNENFNAFILSEDMGKELQNYPPFEAFFGDFSVQGKLNVLFYQKIGEVVTEYPLIAVGEEKGQRVGYILGEGLWRWRLFDYLRDQDHATTQQLLEQITQYVAVKEDKRRFRVHAAKDLFDENERIRMRAEFFNENYELVNDPEVYLTIADEDGNQYEYTFGREQNFYSLDIGFLPVGNYTYTAQTSFNAREFTYNGRFSVESIQLEMYKTYANHNLLQLLADENGGSMIDLTNMLSIPDSLQQKGTLTPVIYTSARTKNMINLPWVFWLLVILMSIEWLSRRLAGTY